MATSARVIALQGDQALEVGKALAARLAELGRDVHVLTAAQLDSADRDDAAVLAATLVGQDTFVVAPSHHALAGVTDALLIALDPHDTPEFAAEKILDRLAEAGAIVLGLPSYTPEQEERIRERLSRLGYIE